MRLYAEQARICLGYCSLTMRRRQQTSLEGRPRPHSGISRSRGDVLAEDPSQKDPDCAPGLEALDLWPTR